MTKKIAETIAKNLRREPCVDTLLIGLLTENLLTVDVLFSPFVENLKDLKLVYLLFLTAKKHRGQRDLEILDQVASVAEGLRDSYKKEEGCEEILLALISLPEEDQPYIFSVIEEDYPHFREEFEKNVVAFIRDEKIRTVDFFAGNESPIEDMFQDMFEPNNILDEFGTNLNLLASKGEFDDLVPYDDTIEELYTILNCKKKPNVILTGIPGCGKTSLVELLARNIIRGVVPESLNNKIIYSVDLARMVGGAEWRGVFEARLTKFVDEVKARKNIIIFIDEIHTLVGAGGNAKTELEASNMLKPALADGSITCIGATTPREYDLKIKQDPALDRRFKKLRVFPPSSSKMTEALPKIIEFYSKKHNVTYSDGFIKNVIRFCDESIPLSSYPDKLVDVIDFCAAKSRVEQEYRGEDMTEMSDEELLQLCQTQVSLDTTPVVTEKYFSLYKQESLSILEDKAVMSDLAKRLRKKILVKDNVEEFFKAVYEANVSIEKPNVLCVYGEKYVGKSFFLENLIEQLRICGVDVLSVSSLNISSLQNLIGENDSLIKKISYYRNPVVIIDDYDKVTPEAASILENGFKAGYLETIEGEIVNLKSATFILSAPLKSNSVGFKEGVRPLPNLSKDILSLSKMVYLREPNEEEKEIFFKEKLSLYKKKLGLDLKIARPSGSYETINRALREKAAKRA